MIKSEIPELKKAIKAQINNSSPWRELQKKDFWVDMPREYKRHYSNVILSPYEEISKGIARRKK